MARSATLVVARRVLRQRRRDRRTIALIVVQPLVIMAIFGYAFGGDVTDARVGVANLDRGTLGAKVLAAVDREVVDLVSYGTEPEVEQAVRLQEVRVGIVFPVNFTRNVESGAGPDARTAYLVFLEDNTNPQVTGAVLAEVLDALAAAVEAETDRSPAFDVEERVVFGPEDASNLDFLVPGIAAFVIFMIAAMLTVVAIVKERTNGTLARVLASPLNRGGFVAGYTLAFGVFSFLQALIVLALATLVFGVSIHGSVLLALLATSLVGASALGLGILLSGLAESEFQAVQSVVLVIFPNMFLAGVFAPIEAMPEVVRPLSRLVPLTYAVDALRGVVNHGLGLREIGPDLAILALFAAGFLGLAALTFGRKSGART